MDSNSKLFNSIMSTNKVVKFNMNGFMKHTLSILSKEKYYILKFMFVSKILKKQVIVSIFGEKKCEMS